MGCGCMDYVEIPVPNVVLSRYGQCGLSEVLTAVTMGHGRPGNRKLWRSPGDIGPWRHCSVIMVPEIHIIDENPPIFDLEWMDQCVDKVSWILLDN